MLLGRAVERAQHLKISIFIICLNCKDKEQNTSSNILQQIVRRAYVGVSLESPGLVLYLDCFHKMQIIFLFADDEIVHLELRWTRPHHPILT